MLELDSFLVTFLELKNEIFDETLQNLRSITARSFGVYINFVHFSEYICFKTRD